jgi:hypothetical protein
MNSAYQEYLQESNLYRHSKISKNFTDKRIRPKTSKLMENEDFSSISSESLQERIDI